MIIDEALTRLIHRAGTLANAMTGVTDQFDDELSELKVAISDGWDALAPPPEAPAPQPAAEAYTVEYHAPAGVYCEPNLIGSAASILELARHGVQNRIFKFEDFEPDENALRIQEIKIVTAEGDIAAHWTDPDSFAQLHADEILGLLEELIGSIEDAKEARSQLDQDIGTIEDTADSAARELQHLRRKGGAA